ncbi:glycosyltransferase [Bacillus sp. FJAT-45066]|uniref:glycosyltransferase n=1 Tax=Bacillus sp. FJAT-45066 TaxID=2011010 RepID=UPI000BB8F487|nr:glycosyltransferase [Bacillus sp. FJAT-45066]
MNKNIHVIVATGEWHLDNLRYRRHRLAEFLLKHPDTEEVIWVCPTPEKKTGHWDKLENGIIQYAIGDLHPHKLARFGRYHDLFNKNKLQSLRKYLEQKQDTLKSLWFTFPGFPAMMDITKWDKSIYDCSDLWATSMTGKNSFVFQLRAASITQAESRIVHAVDSIMCTSDFLKENIVQKYCPLKEVYVYENGVEFGLFSVSTAKQNGVLNNHEPVLGFIGGIKPKLDFPLLIELMKQKQDWTLLLVGPDGTNGNRDFQQLLSLPNVQYIGKVPPDEVPLYMNKIDIGLLPYKASEYNRAVFPLKLFEFLAAGKPVVGANLPSTKKYEQNGVYEYIDGELLEGFVTSINALLEEKDNTELTDKRKAIALKHDWNEIFQTIYQDLLNI